MSAAAVPTALQAPTLAVRGVSLRFGGLQALDDVGFDVARGERLGLIGPNGAGKTTCLRVIAGVLRPDAGRIMLGGATLDGLPVHRRVAAGLAMTHQIVRPLRTMSVLDNVALAWGHRRAGGLLRAFTSVDRREARERARALLERVGVAEYADGPTVGVPLGVLKRLEVARALALEPRVVLFDEPLAGLNHVEAARLADLIGSLADSGLTVILVEHNLREVIRVCDRLVVLESGQVLAEGEPERVMRIPDVVAAYVGEETADA
ncbi:MAG: ABC transporter ATP-binding protein [Burkholderiales bacterium]|nr:MAG: ABC transporter ATP-binding protein [Burkholderiales bacterium]